MNASRVADLRDRRCRSTERACPRSPGCRTGPPPRRTKTQRLRPWWAVTPDGEGAVAAARQDVDPGRHRRRRADPDPRVKPAGDQGKGSAGGPARNGAGQWMTARAKTARCRLERGAASCEDRAAGVMPSAESPDFRAWSTRPGWWAAGAPARVATSRGRYKWRTR